MFCGLTSRRNPLSQVNRLQIGSAAEASRICVCNHTVTPAAFGPPQRSQAGGPPRARRKVYCACAHRLHDITASGPRKVQMALAHSIPIKSGPPRPQVSDCACAGSSCRKRPLASLLPVWWRRLRFQVR